MLNQVKRILFGDSAQDKILRGVEVLEQSVSTTLGPRGRNVGISRVNPAGETYEHIVLHDGVKVAKEVELKDPVENWAVHIIRQAAEQQVDQVGDGTTVTTILASSIYQEARKYVNSGTNPMSLRASLESDTAKLLSEVDKMSTPVKTKQEKIQIATISAEEPIIGELIGSTLDQVGIDGLVTVEESKSSETIVEHQEGLQFDQGYISPYFVTTLAKMEATVEDTYVLLSDKPIKNILELMPLLEKMVKGDETHPGSPRLVIIAEDVADSALATLAVNKVNGALSVNCVKAPGIGDKKKDYLQDIAILTGGKVISGDLGTRFVNVSLDDLGRANRVTSTATATMIVGGMGSKQAITNRVKALKLALEDEDSEFESEKLKERIAKLSGGVSVLKVGGQTEGEMKERKERAEDAVAATRAAIEDGIVPGGEIALLRVGQILGQSPSSRILYLACQAPFRKLLSNAGLGVELLQHEVLSQDTNFGVDVTTGEVKDLVKSGIIDPTKVVKSALSNAVSVSIQLMTTGATITPELSKEAVRTK